MLLPEPEAKHPHSHSLSPHPSRMMGKEQKLENSQKKRRDIDILTDKGHIQQQQKEISHHIPYADYFLSSLQTGTP